MHWHTLLNLAAAICIQHHRKESVDLTRAIIWETLTHIINTKAVNMNNFTACRHLLLRFLHGMFTSPGDDEEELEPVLRQRMMLWQHDALFILLKLTLMTIAGVVSSHRLLDNATLVFPLPSHTLDMAALPPDMRSTLHRPGSLEITPIHFNQQQDVHTLWCETIKTYADLCSSIDTLLFKKSLFCLKVKDPHLATASDSYSIAL